MVSHNTIAVIGDIHGCYNTLVSLFEQLRHINGIYSVGDLVDRGKYSKEVVQFCIDNNIKPVRGNHEDMMLKAIDRSEKFFGFMSEDSQLYYYNGGRETQFSYINSRLFSNFKIFKENIKTLGHYDFIKNLPLKYEFTKVVISHAGIIDGGDDFSILWNRRTPAFIDKLQIFGHTPLHESVYINNYYTNIDTGCVYENKLTAVIVDTKTGRIEETIQENSNSRDIKQSIINAV